MRTIRFLLCVALVGSLAACAHSSIEDCQTTEWFSLGHRDGRVGAPVSVFESYRAACREADTPPDREAYAAGRREGLTIYCTDSSGFQVGRGGRVYHHVCPLDTEKSFLAGRARGMRLAGCRAELYVFDQHLATLERELAFRRQTLEATTLPAADRDRLRREIENLNAIYKRTMGEMDDVEIRCLNQL
ncbi:MAG: DUF2799 domain-containing protein [Desulfobacterales bacterium]|nr:DUF2799 domain-containing protein [Desulfobacterales bacterium]